MADNNAQLQSLLRELEALKQLNDFLVEYICDRVTQVASYFRGYIMNMAQTGVPVQECDEFRDKYYAVDQNNLEKLRNMIINGDLPMIRKYIEQVLRQLASINYNVGRPSLKPPAQVSTSTPSNLNANTGGPQDYEKQADAICKFMNFLVAERDELADTLRKYQECCNQMILWGVPRQVVEHYAQNFAQANANQIKTTALHIQVDDYKQLAGLFKEILASLSELGKNYSQTPKSM